MLTFYYHFCDARYLAYIQSLSLSCNNIKTFDFSTQCTTILHYKLKRQIKRIGSTLFLRKE